MCSVGLWCSSADEFGDGQTMVRVAGEDSESGLRHGVLDARDECGGSGLCGEVGRALR